MPMPNRMPALLVSTAALLGLAGCETPTTARYAISPDNALALRAMNVSGVAVGTIAEPAAYDVACRLDGHVRVADGLTHAQYIRSALQDELKIAGAYATGTPRVTLTGVVTQLNLASMHGMTHGEWDIGLHLTSSNGRSLDVAEHYRFKSGFGADAACKNTAEAFLPAVQDLVHQVVASPEFPALVA